MKLINLILKDWNFSRILKLVLGISILISYHYNNENLFLMIGSILSVQAVFNISCPGGSCNTASNSKSEPLFKFKKYEPEK